MDAAGGRLKDLTTKPSSVFDCKTAPRMKVVSVSNIALQYLKCPGFAELDGYGFNTLFSLSFFGR